MVRYISDKQLSIEEFKTPFQAKLSAENRWVKLRQVVPWDEFAAAYMTMMNNGFGCPGVFPRILLGALITLSPVPCRATFIVDNPHSL